MAIMAELRGKLSEQRSSPLEHMEDLLTSNVLQLLRYLPPHIGIEPVLSHAVNLSGTQLRVPSPLESWSVKFWPKYRVCEPDLEIELVGTNARLLLFVEAKYRSGKSGAAEYQEDDPEEYVTGSDQLEREWQQLQVVAGADDRAIVYLTAHHVVPKVDLEESIAAIKDARAAQSIYWLSWRGISSVLAGVSPQTPHEKLVLSDIRDLLAHKHLVPLRLWDFMRDAKPQHLTWQFDRIQSALKWSHAPRNAAPLSWTFRERTVD